MSNPNARRITNPQMLKELCADEHADVCVVLSGGVISSRDIKYSKDDDSWCVHRNIDGSHQDFDSTDEFLSEEDMVLKAMISGALWTRDVSVYDTLAMGDPSRLALVFETSEEVFASL